MNIFFFYFIVLFTVSRSVDFYVEDTDKVRVWHWQVKFQVLCFEVDQPAPIVHWMDLIHTHN